MTANEVAYMVGFSSPAYFNKCFHDFNGYSPGKVRNGNLSIPEGPLEEVLPKLLKKGALGQIPLSGRAWLFGLVIIIITIIILVFPGTISRTALDGLISSDQRISVAVMPFRNMTNDTTWNIWQGAIQNSLITYLTNSEELIVRQSEPVNILLRGKGLTDYAAITPALSGNISRKLNASQYISGSIIEAGNEIRIDAQIFDTRKGDVLRSYKIQRPGTGTVTGYHEYDDYFLGAFCNGAIVDELVGTLIVHYQVHNFIGNQGSHYIGILAWNNNSWELTIVKAVCPGSQK